MADTIADMFTIIRNGYAAEKDSVSVPYSKFKMALAKNLQSEGYIKGATRRGKKIKKTIEIRLLYKDGKPAITKIKRVSKQSRRVYRAYRDIFSVGRGYGNLILSTPKGIMTGEQARKDKVGGEVIAEIW